MSALTTFEKDLLGVAEKVKNGVEAAAADAGKVLAWVTNEAPTIAGLASLAGPSGSTIASLGLKLIGLAGTAIEGAGSAAGANGVSVTLDQEVIADVKALIAAVKSI
jgi:hypothetical protein